MKQWKNVVKKTGVGEDQLSFVPFAPSQAKNYLPILQSEQSTVRLFKTPYSTMNIQTTQLLSKVKYPRTWEEVQAFVLQDKYFIISANAKGKSHLLIYGIEKDSLQPLKTFVFSGKIKILQQMNEQFVIMTELPASEQHIQALIKQGSGSLAYFPKVTTARNYGFEETQLSQMECATLAHHLTSQDPASFFMLIKLNIDALDLDPEVHYLFGHLDAVAVGNEYFYLLKNQE